MHFTITTTLYHVVIFTAMFSIKLGASGANGTDSALYMESIKS